MIHFLVFCYGKEVRDGDVKVLTRLLTPWRRWQGRFFLKIIFLLKQRGAISERRAFQTLTYLDSPISDIPTQASQLFSLCFSETYNIETTVVEYISKCTFFQKQIQDLWI